LLALVAVAVAGLLAVWGRESLARARYEQVQVGMSREEAEAILEPSGSLLDFCETRDGEVVIWYTRDGATIRVDYDGDGKVRDKEFEEGDQSFKAKVKRLIDWLPLRF
jgi:hypothetical protein